MSVDDRLLAVFQGVFGENLAEIPDEASPETIEGWDSANHVNLVLALEAEFDLRFDTDEISELTTVGAIRKRIAVG
jgi:acyl carrier protein